MCVAERPCITLEGDGSLFFRPTAVGSCSKTTLSIRNFSRLPLHFHWRVCDSDHRVLSVQPDSGVLQPNESQVTDCVIIKPCKSCTCGCVLITDYCPVQVQTWSFTPLEEMAYSMKPSLIFWPIHKPECKRSRLFLKVVGLSARGSIQVRMKQ